MKKRATAFTLIELLVVMVIIGILATIGIASYNGMKEKAENVKVLAAASNAKKAILATTTEAETKLTAYYTFEDDDVADPIIDRSGSNNPVSHYIGTYSASDDTVGGGKSLRLENGAAFRKTGMSNNSPGPAEKVTISVLFKLNTFATTGEQTKILGAKDTYIAINTNPNFFYPRLSFRNNSPALLNGTTEIKIGKWYHALVSFEESTDTIRLYLNGKLEAETTTYAGVITGDFNETWLGGYVDSYKFDGWIDEAIIAPVAVELE